MDRTHGNRRGENGIALLLAALSLTLLIAFVGMAVDLGYFLSAKSQMQSAADLAALAAVADLPDEKQAQEAALESAALNGFTHAAAETNLRIQTTPAAVEVTIERPSPAIFTAVFGRSHLKLVAHAKATAERKSLE